MFFSSQEMICEHAGVQCSDWHYTQINKLKIHGGNFPFKPLKFRGQRNIQVILFTRQTEVTHEFGPAKGWGWHSRQQSNACNKETQSSDQSYSSRIYTNRMFLLNNFFYFLFLFEYKRQLGKVKKYMFWQKLLFIS